MILFSSVGGRKGKDQVQAELHFIDENEPVKSWEYAVLVCNAHYEIENIGQLYRDRADCENGFDEIKNQWGWDGYSTHDIERCALSARAVALVYNWWSWYVRLAHPKTRLEAITSRPKLAQCSGALTSHGGRKTILLTITHEAATQINALVTNVSHGLRLVQDTAPQLTKPQRWFALVRYIVERIFDLRTQAKPRFERLGDWVTEENRMINSLHAARHMRARAQPMTTMSQRQSRAPDTR